ncbi:MAG TPA: undecaprenyl-diphosphate phosphatase [Caulobacteraceae bacterium]|jgi:undecaprenyl-diphosphatase|nr:undecaprenyl-diphosphate phosphatase [Caulobacteraceae bacterium]
MDWFYAVLLGVLEGLTEFIPVSSTGHLLLAKQALGLSASWDTFVVAIQLGAILAVITLYFSRFWNIFLRLPHDPVARKFVLSILIAFLPAAVVGVLLHHFIKTVLFESPRLICWSLMLGGLALLGLDRLGRDGRWRDAFAIPLPTAFGVGVVQCLAMIPGVSRSGATIAGGLLLGCEKRAAAEFSFFLAIPTMFGATALDLYENRGALGSHGAALIAVGFVVSFVVAMAGIKMFLDLVSRHGFWPFAIWRILVGAAGLALLTFAR